MPAERSFFLFFFFVLCSGIAVGQENSPYSRYGLGDIVPYSNIGNRSMGGISAASTDFQSINFTNPAAFGSLSSTIFDMGSEIDIRTLKSNISPDKFKSTYLILSYVQLGIPLSTKKMIKKGNTWGLSFGLHPVTRINYKVSSSGRIPGVDSINTVFEGSGGMSQFTLGTGVKLKRLRAGLNMAYNFGNKDYSTRVNIVNDTVIYYRSNAQSSTRFSGLSFTGGLMYDIPVKENTLRLGIYGSLFNTLKASRTDIEETFIYDNTGAPVPIDTVSIKKDIKGDIVMPYSWGAGFTWNGKNWNFGVDVEMSNWKDYRFFGSEDPVQNSWRLRLGAQYYPATDNTSADKYFQFVRYRVGFFYGPDYIRLDKSRPEFAFTLGAGFPLTSFQLLRRGEFVVLNTGVELGARGQKDIGTLREGVVRFNFGLSMNARWFQRAKFD